MILCTSATGLESHVANDTKKSWPCTYKAINCKDPYRLTSATSPFLGSSIFKTTTFIVKSCMKLVIYSNYKRSTLTTTHWKVKYHPAYPTALMPDSSIFFGIDSMGKFQAELGSLLKLQTLQLSGNNLTGEIPTSLVNLSSLSKK